MRNKLYVSLMLLMFVFGILTFIMPQKETTQMERRNLKTISNINVKELSSSLNEIMNDQICFREQAIFISNKLKQISNIPFNKILLKIKDDVVMLDSEYFISDFLKLSVEDKNTALNRAYNIQQISKKYPDIKTYVYFPTKIEDTTLLDSDSIKSVYPSLKEMFIEQLGDLVSFASLQIDTIDTYKKYYYKTDCHWNAEGSYQGYKDIVELINNDFNIGNPKEVNYHRYPFDFYGNYAQKIAFLCNPEHLVNMEVQTGPYKYYVNGALRDDDKSLNDYSNYGNISQVISDYEYVYEIGDFERIYDFNQPDKPNILIFVDSFISPLKKALASHFNKTILIDMRTNDGSFNLDNYIEKYNIDIILVTQYYDNLFFNGYLFVPLD